METEIVIKGWFVRDGHHECLDSHRIFEAARFASMRQPQVKARVRPDIARQFQAVAESEWPGQGRRATDRLAREAIRRYARKNDGKATGRARG